MTIKNTYNLFLDDVRYPKDSFNYMHDFVYVKEVFQIVRTYEEFVKVIEEQFKQGCFPILVSFDHDLCDMHFEEYLDTGDINYEKVTEKTGYHCARWLCDFCMDNNLKLPNTLVHSQNPYGAEKIRSIFTNYRQMFE